jgi:autonomous glycyl radical cofactor GrcA
VSEDKKSGRSRRTRAVVDRVEDGGVAVLLVGEEELKVELPASLLPEGAEGGSHLVVNVSLDDDSRRAAEDRVRAMQEKLEKRGGEGRKDFKL